MLTGERTFTHSCYWQQRQRCKGFHMVAVLRWGNTMPEKKHLIGPNCTHFPSSFTDCSLGDLTISCGPYNVTLFLFCRNAKGLGETRNTFCCLIGVVRSWYRCCQKRFLKRTEKLGGTSTSLLAIIFQGMLTWMKEQKSFSQLPNTRKKNQDFTRRE